MQIWDMRKDRPTSRTSGQQPGDDDHRHNAGAADLSSQCLPGRRTPRVPVIHDVRSAVREPFWSDTARANSANCNKTKRTSSTVADPVEGLVMFHWRRSWTTPRPIPAAKATGRLTMPPSSAASRARSKRPGERTWVKVLVWLGEARMAVKAERAPARVQATVEVRRTQTPDSRADSVFSAEARMARPQWENRMNAARPRATTGATTRVTTSPGGKRNEPM